MSTGGNNERQLPNKLWLVYGQTAARSPRSRSYSTDPRDYDLPGLEPMTDEEYAAVSNKVRVFRDLEHAADFCYDCGFEWSIVRGYRRSRKTYRYDSKVTDELLDYPW